MGKEIGTEKSHNPYEIRVKEELDTVYITSSGSKYLKKMDALCAESQIQMARESREKRREKLMNMVDILMHVLKENNWGIFYKSKPIQTLTLQDDAPLLKINEVDSDSIEEAILNFLQQLKMKDLKDWATQETEDTTPPSPTDLNQTEN